METNPSKNLEEIIAKNQIALEKIEQRINRIEKHFTWSTIFGFIKAIVIIGPIVVGVIYLSPFVKVYVDKVRPLFEVIDFSANKDNGTAKAPAINIDLLSPQARTMLCDPQIREVIIEENCSR